MQALEALTARAEYHQDASGHRRAPSIAKRGSALLELVEEAISPDALAIATGFQGSTGMDNPLEISPLSVNVEELYRRPSVKYHLFYPLSPSLNYEFKKPLEVALVRGAEFDGYIVSSEDLNKFAAGSSSEDAILNFEDRVISDFLSLSGTPKEMLSLDARELLAKYQEYFIFHGSKKGTGD